MSILKSLLVKTPFGVGKGMEKSLFIRLAVLCCAVLATDLSLAQLRYEQEYPVIDYSMAKTTDPFSMLVERINRGETSLEHASEEGQRGYLDGLLAALDIDPTSQMLVFSKTSLKTRFVNSATPRAIYFNDEVYVAYIANTRAIEISAMDPVLGPVFFSLAQDPQAEIVLDRELNRCLRCHDSYSLTGGGVPRFLLSSVLADGDGEIVSHEINEITDTSTPINRRWGGWYVTGSHGQQETMGNLVIRDTGMLRHLDLSGNGNKAGLNGLLDLSPYPTQYSDIVALLVIEHQIEVQNLITRVNYRVRTIIDTEGYISDEQLKEITDPLVNSMLMVNEVGLTEQMIGFSGYTEYFQGLGPKDSQGRSLRDFDLNTRTFKYPLSYLIYTPAFDALQADAKAYFYTKVNNVLTEHEQSEVYSHLSSSDRKVILDILKETKPDFFQGQK